MAHGGEIGRQWWQWRQCADGAATAAIIVVSLGLTRVHRLLAVALNLIAVGGLAPTVWGWRSRPVYRWFVLGSGVGVAGGWLTLIAMAIGA
jgi:hypothetical protein